MKHLHIMYNCDKYLSRLLMMSFFMPLHIQVLVLIPLCLFFAVRDFIFQEKKGAIPFQYAALLGGIYLLYTAYLPFSSGADKKNLLVDLELKSSLLLLPLAIACLRKDTIDAIRKELPYFIIGCLLSCAIGNGLYAIRSFPFTDAQLLNHVFYRRFFESCTGVHPTYMGMYLCFSAAILLMGSRPEYRLKTVQLAAVLFLLFLFSLALLPKTPLIALLAVLGYYCVRHFREKARWKAPALALVAAVAVALAVPSSSQRIKEMKGFLPHAGKADPIGNSINMRQIIWRVDRQTLQQHWLAGVGPGHIKEELTNQYFALGTLLGMPLEYYDTHNEYMNIWISFGLAGIVLFLFILIFQLVSAMKRRDHLYICLLAILGICFCTENILANQHGVVFYAFFTSLLFFAGGYQGARRIG